jgi:peptide/nickel transport system substrate-binding protein
MARPGWLLALAIAGLAATLATACSGNGCSADSPETTGSVIVVARARDVTTLDPGKATDADSADVLSQIYETLVRYSPDGFEVQPGLAESWSKSDDLRTWTFRLRKNVRFHDGTPLDADAVVFSFRRQSRKGPDQSQFEYWNSTFAETIERVEKIDDLTVRFHLSRPFAPFLASLALFPVSVVSPSAVRELGERFAQEPVGTGPFRFVSWDRSAGRITLRRFEEYWGRKARAEKLVFRRIGDSRQRILALESGAAQIVRNVDPGALQMVRLHPDLRASVTRGNTVAYMAMNTTKPPFDDPRARRAVNYAVRTRAVVKLVFQGLAEPAIGPVPPVLSWAFNQKVRTYHRDPARARKLLKQAGYVDDPTQRPTLYVMETPRPYLARPILAARMIARDLESVGMPIRLVVLPFKRQTESIIRGDHHLALYGWVGDNGDPDNFVTTLLGPQRTFNIAFWKHEEFTRLIRLAGTARKRSARARYYKKAQEIVAEQAPWVPLAHTKMVVALRRELVGFRLGPSSILHLKNVEIR